MEKQNEVEERNEMAEFGESEVELQRKYVEELKERGPAAFSLVYAEAFLESMRDSGYKSTATAIDEFVDNSIQAQAQRVDIVYTEASTKVKKRSSKTISNIAVIDDGHGMEPDMIRAAVLWGGTHRHNSRKGFGRYGFGLPSAAVSITKVYEVYSKTDGNSWHKIKINLPDICSGKHTDANGMVIAPAAEKCELPDFVAEELGKRDLKHGTVILLLEPDRPTSGFRKPNQFHEKIMQHLGLIYRYTLRNCPIYVKGKKVEAVDPLFLDPNARYFDVGNGIFAEERDELQFDVKAASGGTGRVRFRFSYMHPRFQRTAGGTVIKERFNIMKENQAYFIVTRSGRQIDLVRLAGFPKEAYNKALQNYDRNWAVELDFDPVLDEDFGITVNKQQVSISDRMWEIFESQGVGAMVKALWEAHSQDRSKMKSKQESDEGKVKDSEEIMAEAEKFTRKPKITSPEKEQKAKQKVLDEAEKQAQETGRPKDEHVVEIIKITTERPYRVILEEREGLPFFSMDQFGAQKRLFINTSHRFYKDLYSGPNPTTRTKTALELLLYAIGSAEIDSTGDMELFYQNERAEWSKRLNISLSLLDRRDPVEDAESAQDAVMETAAAAS